MPAGTAYTKRYPGGFSDLPALTTPADSAFLNAVEAALLQLLGAAPSADGQVAQWDQANTRFGPALILNKNIDPAAAIAKSKLDFTGANGIVNADISGAAAIDKSKLNLGGGWVNADINAAAAIAISKLADPTTGKVVGSSGGAAAAVYPPGYEVAVAVSSANYGPTGITATGNGDALFNFPTATYENAPHIMEMWFGVNDTGGLAVVEYRLHDGTAPGPLVQADAFQTPGTNPGNPYLWRVRFVPSAGPHTYHVRWRDTTGGRIYTQINAQHPMIARIVKE